MTIDILYAKPHNLVLTTATPTFALVWRFLNQLSIDFDWLLQLDCAVLIEVPAFPPVRETSPLKGNFEHYVLQHIVFNVVSYM